MFKVRPQYFKSFVDRFQTIPNHGPDYEIGKYIFKTLLLHRFFVVYPTCASDKLVLSDEIDSSTQCGGSANQLPPPLELKGKKVQFAFTSDEDTSAAGFYLNYNITRLQQGNKY